MKAERAIIRVCPKSDYGSRELILFFPERSYMKRTPYSFFERIIESYLIVGQHGDASEGFYNMTSPIPESRKIEAAEMIRNYEKNYDCKLRIIKRWIRH